MADSETPKSRAEWLADQMRENGMYTQADEVIALERRLREAERERDEARVAHGAAMALRLDMMKRAESAEAALVDTQRHVTTLLMQDEEYHAMAQRVLTKAESAERARDEAQRDARRYIYLYENALIPFTYHTAIHELNDRAGWVLREIGVISGKNLGWAETRHEAIDSAIDSAIGAKGEKE